MGERDLVAMHRGEVWWARLPAPAGRRPVVLVSRDRAIQVRDVVTVIRVTRRMRGIPTEVLLTAGDGLPQTCVANADVIDTFPKSVFEGRICALPSSRMRAIDRAIVFALGL